MKTPLLLARRIAPTLVALPAPMPTTDAAFERLSRLLHGATQSIADHALTASIGDLPAVPPPLLTEWLLNGLTVGAGMLVVLKLVDHFKRKPPIEVELEKLFVLLRGEITQSREETAQQIADMRARIDLAHQRVDSLTRDLNNRMQRLPGDVVDLLHKTGAIH